MKTTYNFILSNLLWNSEDNEFIDGFCNELVEKGVVIEVEYLTEQLFTTEPYAEVKNLLDQTKEASHLKLKHVHAQDFEGAALARSKERTLIAEIEKAGFNFHHPQRSGFALYHVDADKKGRKLKFLVHTNSEEFIAFIEGIREGGGAVNGKR